MQVAVGCFVDLRRFDDVLQQDGREAVGEQEQDGCQEGLEIDALVEERTDGFVVRFAVAPGDEYLGTDAEAERYHEDDRIEYAGDGRSAKFDFAYTAQKGGIGHSDHLFHNQADKDGVGYEPDLLVGVVGRIGSFHIVFGIG